MRRSGQTGSPENRTSRRETWLLPAIFVPLAVVVVVVVVVVASAAALFGAPYRH